MAANSIKVGLMFAALIGLTGCGATGKYVPTNLSQSERQRVENGEAVRLMRVLPDSALEKLVLTPATYPKGVYVCAVENLSKPWLPKLSMLVAGKLAQKGILVAADQSKADAVLYFETWFDSYSTHADGVKLLSSNPAIGGKNFAAKMEHSIQTGNPPDVHKHFHFALDPLSLAALNSNDEQKFIYVALTAVEIKGAIDYPGDGQGLPASKNPWVGPGAAPSVRTLIGNFDGAIATEKAVLPMLDDAIELMAERVGRAPL